MDEQREERPELSTRPAEQLLIDALKGHAPQRVLCTSLGRGQFAAAAARLFPTAKVACHFFDLYRAELARQHWATESANGEESLPQIVCSPDFPAEEFDLAALPTSAQGEAELTRELLQTAHQRLTLGGVLLVSTDNSRDRWLHEELQKIFPTVRRQDFSAGTVYVASKEAPLKRVRNFTAEFAFRDAERLLHVVSRPGVFSHRRVDPGARQLLNAMEVHPGERVLDIGCGSGVVALAAAVRQKEVQVVALDSQARAIECTAKGAELNSLNNITVEHSATGLTSGAETFDRVVANPPYYAGFRIARFFVETSRTALRKGGWLYVVTKQPDWYEENLPPLFAEVQIDPSKDYWIVRARR